MESFAASETTRKGPVAMAGPDKFDSGCLPTAGGRNDPIHSQIFHHLAVVIKAVSDN